MYLQTKLPSIDISSGLTTGTEYRAFRWLNWVGHVLVDEVDDGKVVKSTLSDSASILK